MRPAGFDDLAVSSTFSRQFRYENDPNAPMPPPAHDPKRGGGKMTFVVIEIRFTGRIYAFCNVVHAR